MLPLGFSGRMEDKWRLHTNGLREAEVALDVHPLVVVLGWEETFVLVKSLADGKEVVRLA
jgi:hypothetical protein